jgi:hypothetical protein
LKKGLRIKEITAKEKRGKRKMAQTAPSGII